jgi:hypothetical protein
MRFYRVCDARISTLIWPASTANVQLFPAYRILLVCELE